MTNDNVLKQNRNFIGKTILSNLNTELGKIVSNDEIMYGGAIRQYILDKDFSNVTHFDVCMRRGFFELEKVITSAGFYIEKQIVRDSDRPKEVSQEYDIIQVHVRNQDNKSIATINIAYPIDAVDQLNPIVMDQIETDVNAHWNNGVGQTEVFCSKNILRQSSIERIRNKKYAKNLDCIAIKSNPNFIPKGLDSTWTQRNLHLDKLESFGSIAHVPSNVNFNSNKKEKTNMTLEEFKEQVAKDILDALSKNKKEDEAIFGEAIRHKIDAGFFRNTNRFDVKLTRDRLAAFSTNLHSKYTLYMTSSENAKTPAEGYKVTTYMITDKNNASFQTVMHVYARQISEAGKIPVQLEIDCDSWYYNPSNNLSFQSYLFPEFDDSTVATKECSDSWLRIKSKKFQPLSFCQYSTYINIQNSGWKVDDTIKGYFGEDNLFRLHPTESKSEVMRNIYPDKDYKTFTFDTSGVLADQSIKNCLNEFKKEEGKVKIMGINLEDIKRWGKNGSIRTAGELAVDGAREALLISLKSSGMEESHAVKFLETPFGKTAIQLSLAAGFALTPVICEDPRAKVAAEEFGTAGIASGELNILKPLLALMVPTLKAFLNSMPMPATATRVDEQAANPVRVGEALKQVNQELDAPTDIFSGIKQQAKV